MTMATEDKSFLTVTEASNLMGCTVSWIRQLLRSGQVSGQKFGPRSWMVSRESAIEHKKKLTPRSVGKRPTIKKAAKRRKKA